MTRTPTAHVLRTLPFSALPLTFSLVLIPGTALGATGGQPPLAEDSTQLYDTNVPLDGVVAGQSECGPCRVEDVWITAADGTPVEGVVTDLSDLRRVGAWAFTPSSPWLPGEYFAHYADGDPAPFTVIDAVVSPPDVEPSLGSPITQRRDHVQCVSQAPTAESPEGEFETFALSGWTHGYFRAEVSGTSKAQYTYMIGVNGEVRFDPYGAAPLFEIGPDTEEICYWMRAQRLVSREETLLVNECYSPARLDEYVVENPSPEEFQAFLRDECVLPPAGFVAGWCSSFQSAIDAGACSELGYQNIEACESALSLCMEGEPHSPAPGPDDDPDASGGASMGNDDPEESSGGASMGGDSNSPSSDSHDDSRDSSGGCSVSAARSSTPMGGGGALLAILASVTALRLRRTRDTPLPRWR